jgi:glucose/arabinose dehydrogenase
VLLPVTAPRTGSIFLVCSRSVTATAKGEDVAIERRVAQGALPLALLLFALLPVTVGFASRPDRQTALQNSSEDLTLLPVLTGLAAPTYVTHAGDGSGRLFVLERAGTIRVGVDGSVLPEPFLDITSLVHTDNSEQGLLGLAFDPDFAQNGRFFVYFTALDGADTLMRFGLSADPNRADPDSGLVIFAFPDREPNHNGGMITFGPDGYLYVSIGDEGGANDQYGNAQDLGTPFGKILRIDVSAGSMAAPPDNPFVDMPGALPEIWAYGLRNPWRFSFDRQTGDLWIGDVGQGSYEEIDVQPAGSGGGENYGWNAMEGMHCFQGACDPAAYTSPVAEYPHDDDSGQTIGCSVSGGYVYRGSELPELFGQYFFGDFCSGLIWTLRAAGADWEMTQLFDTQVLISSFGEDESGELYVVDIAAGIVYRLDAEIPALYRTWARTDKPVADAQADRTWMWGSTSYSHKLLEAYVESPGGVRLVAYFDKSRMEITRPDAPDHELWYVTNGLLAKELITGQKQVGDNSFEPGQPADVNVAGDPGSGPSYADLTPHLDDEPFPDGQPLIWRLDNQGTVSADPSLSDMGVTAMTVPDSGINHAIASVFWEFMNSTGMVWEDGQLTTDRLFENPFYATGFPITEAYWARVSIGGNAKDVLLQCFERRCLTYTPDNPPGWKVESGNVGQHYLRWRAAGRGLRAE